MTFFRVSAAVLVLSLTFTLQPAGAQEAEQLPSLAAAIEQHADGNRKWYPAARAFYLWYIPPPTPLDLWVDGYLDAGGPSELVDIFIRHGGIGWCESRHDFSANRQNIDVGFAQLNQIHKPWIREAIGHNDWITAMLDPWWNGWAAGTLAAGSGTGPWYMSKSCWS